MNRDSEAALLDFCARQKDAFREASWLGNAPLADRREMAAVCLFLAGVDWYGHKTALAGLARTLQDGAATPFEVLARAVRFDCLRFSSMLKRRIRHA